MKAPRKNGEWGRDTLGRRLLKLIFPKRSALVTLNKWAEEGKTLQKYQLNRIVRELRTHKRHKHAIEICEWMTTQPDMKLLPGDYAVHLDLVGKVRGLTSAEKFFEDLPAEMIDKTTCTSLLHCYVQHNLTTKAEALMKRMSECGYLSHALPYNHMLTLYISNDQFEKVSPLVEELKRSTFPDIVTYNLLLSICRSRDDVDGAEKIMLELKKKNIKADWITYSTITSIYTNTGHVEKAKEALKDVEIRVSRKHRVAYASLITLHANLNDKKGVLKIWERMGSIFRKMNDAEYMSMMSSLVKLGDIRKAENIYSEWESVTGTKDPKLPNILLQAYMKEDSMDKAEKFHKETVEKGFVSTYITWETLALGYLSKKRTDKVLECLKKALSCLKKWNPNLKLVRDAFNELEKIGDTKGAEEFLVMLRDAGYVTTEIYNSLLRTYKTAGKMPLIVVERMKKDEVELDAETHELLNATSKLCVDDVPSGLC
ncbi:pentatricopeptide repeat-containing protein At4g02820, mitochondrial [Aristolochia californica]|uniref:pentatricopeptide repeat-containing protein At4g02820, mitochondrial n=1 Tax=Aristolochia californica TaxID=171875 RepID=UPI0035E05E84